MRFLKPFFVLNCQKSIRQKHVLVLNLVKVVANVDPKIQYNTKHFFKVPSSGVNQ